MDNMIVYRDESYPTSWINEDWSSEITNYLKSKDFVEMNAVTLRSWLRSRIKNADSHDTVLVFSQDIIPDTIMSGLNSPNDLIRRYLDQGGRIIWIGNIPFWSKGSISKKANDIWMHGVPFSMLGVEPLIAEFSTSCEWTGKWKGIMESRWYSHRPVNIDIIEELNWVKRINLKVWPMAVVDVTLLPCTWNATVITRWKKAGTKVGSFGLTLLGTGGNMTLTDEYPNELSLTPQKLACAW